MADCSSNRLDMSTVVCVQNEWRSKFWVAEIIALGYWFEVTVGWRTMIKSMA